MPDQFVEIEYLGVPLTVEVEYTDAYPKWEPVHVYAGNRWYLERPKDQVDILPLIMSDPGYPFSSLVHSELKRSKRI